MIFPLAIAEIATSPVTPVVIPGEVESKVEVPKPA